MLVLDLPLLPPCKWGSCLGHLLTFGTHRTWDSWGAMRTWFTSSPWEEKQRSGHVEAAQLGCPLARVQFGGDAPLAGGLGPLPCTHPPTSTPTPSFTNSMEFALVGTHQNWFPRGAQGKTSMRLPAGSKGQETSGGWSSLSPG